MGKICTSCGGGVALPKAEEKVEEKCEGCDTPETTSSDSGEETSAE